MKSKSGAKSEAKSGQATEFERFTDGLRKILYVSVEPFHLFRYVDEQAWRYNHRKDMKDADRMSVLASQVVGKRLTFAELTGKVGKTSLN